MDLSNSELIGNPVFSCRSEVCNMSLDGNLDESHLSVVQNSAVAIRKDNWERKILTVAL
jgi:hypothetical protein